MNIRIQENLTDNSNHVHRLQDQFIMSLYSAVDETQEEKIPFDQAFSNQMGLLSEANKNRPLAQSVGNISIRFGFVCYPNSPIALGGKVVSYLGKRLGASDSIVGKTLEASLWNWDKNRKSKFKN